MKRLIVVAATVIALPLSMAADCGPNKHPQHRPEIRVTVKHKPKPRMTPVIKDTKHTEPPCAICG